MTATEWFKIIFMELEKLTFEDLLAHAQKQEVEIAEMKEASDSQATECVAHSEKIAEQAELIEKLNAVIGNAKAQTSIDVVTKKEEAPVIPAEFVEVDGEQYQWLRAGFRLPGEINKYTAQEASGNVDVLKRLLAIEGQSILKKLA